jgi:dTDP-4-dehydrorhamnose reductase
MSATTAELGRPAPRPEYSVLGTQWEEAIHLPHWQDGLLGYLAERGS